ncbi:MAG: ferritin family protein [Spirochaetes bacterium]|nr:ferritin family protein [Spirochaetota bacterium]
MSHFNASEIFQFAMAIEENGQRFYLEMAKKLSDEKVIDLFQYLAKEEEIHKKTFGDLLSKFEKYEPGQNYPQEYFAYLQAYAGNFIFDKKVLQAEIERISDPKDALDFAIRRELDSILYYQEMKIWLPKDQLDKIEKIVQEERKHFQKLTEVKKAIQ